MKTNKTNKNSTDRKQKTNTKLSMTKKICLMKKENRSLSKRIKVINWIYYILAIICSFPIQFRIMEMIDEISNVTYNFVILITCMMTYYIGAIAMYYMTASPIVETLKDRINYNNETIKLIKYHKQQEFNEIESEVKSSKLFGVINDIRGDLHE